MKGLSVRLKVGMNEQAGLVIGNRLPEDAACFPWGWNYEIRENTRKKTLRGDHVRNSFLTADERG